MATHELYLGGPANPNVGRHAFPAATFSASGAAFKAMEPSAHKGPAQFALSRVLDLGYGTASSCPNDAALRSYFSENTVATGDTLDLIVIPKNTLVYGLFVNVINPASGTTTTLTFSIGGTAVSLAVDLTTAGAQLIAVTGVAAAGKTSGAFSLATASFNIAPQMLSAVAAFAAVTDLDGMKVEVAPLVSWFEGGR